MKKLLTTVLVTFFDNINGVRENINGNPQNLQDKKLKINYI